MFGSLGCLLCITGSLTIVLHAPPERELNSVIEVFQLAMQPGENKGRWATTYRGQRPCMQGPCRKRDWKSWGRWAWAARTPGGLFGLFGGGWWRLKGYCSHDATTIPSLFTVESTTSVSACMCCPLTFREVPAPSVSCSVPGVRRVLRVHHHIPDPVRGAPAWDNQYLRVSRHLLSGWLTFRDELQGGQGTGAG